MKLNISYPTNGTQKIIEIDDEKKLHNLYDRRISHEIEGAALGDEFKGYVFKITGGADKQGFPMMQGVQVQGRVRLLLGEKHASFRPKRHGHRKRQSVRGCIVGPDLSMLNMAIVKKGEADIEGLTDKVVPRKMQPKRAAKIRAMFGLTKDDNVFKFVLRTEIPSKKEGGKPTVKAPKVQRLVTSSRVRDKRRKQESIKASQAKAKADAAEYAKLLALRNKEAAQRRQSQLSKKRESIKRQSQKKKAESTESAQPAKKQKSVSSSTTEKVAKKSKSKKDKTDEPKTKSKKTKSKSKSSSSDAAADAAPAEKTKKKKTKSTSSKKK